MPKPLTSQPPTRARGGDRPRAVPSNPDILVRLTPTLEDPFQLVVVSKHIPDWGTSGELQEVTEARLQLLGNMILKGAWFLNPGFTVNSQAASAEFFRDARHARRDWLRQTRQSISLRREARSVVAKARQVALADLDLTGDEGSSQRTPLTSLTPDQRLDVLKAGHIAKQMTFSGLMIIDGDHVLPRTWNQMADEFLGPEPPARSRVHRRRATQFTPAAPFVLEPSKSTRNLTEQSHEEN